MKIIAYILIIIGAFMLHPGIGLLVLGFFIWLWRKSREDAW